MQLYALEYNSERENLIISEHGRHVQKLINHAITIEDRSKRQRFVESVVNLMHQMNPQTKNVAEYKERLWKHVFRISDYKLDVDAPDGVLITKPSEDKRVANLGYPKMEKRFRHYGRNVLYPRQIACCRDTHFYNLRLQALLHTLHNLSTT